MLPPIHRRRRCPAPMTVAAPPLDSVTDHAEALLRSGRSREARDRLMSMLPRIGDGTTARRFVKRSICSAQRSSSWVNSPRRRSSFTARWSSVSSTATICSSRVRRTPRRHSERPRQSRTGADDVCARIAAYQRLGEARGLAAAHHNRGITFRQIGKLERADDSDAAPSTSRSDAAMRACSCLRGSDEPR